MFNTYIKNEKEYTIIMTNTANEQIWKKILNEFLKNPRDVKTVPMTFHEPKWFYVLTVNDNLYVESGRNHNNKSKISAPRQIKQLELEAMLNLYHRRMNGEKVSAEAQSTTQNQVYWYGIFAEMQL